MFIKKDLRKIPEILEDAEDERRDLKLSKRAAEFNESIQVLRIPKYNTTALANLKILNLYENHIKSLEGIGHLDVTPVEEINLGGNDLDHLPLEFGRLKTLRSLWLDDNNFEEFPMAICQLVNLESLRFSSNQLSAVPPTICHLTELSTLALDNNLFTVFPENILALTGLKYLWLRQNKLQEIPEGLTALHNLETLSLSSNEIITLPTLIPPLTKSQGDKADEPDVMETDEDHITPYFPTLKKVYINGNKLSDIPELWAHLPKLEHINLANNALYAVPPPWNYVFLDADTLVSKGQFTVTSSSNDNEKNKLDVNMFGNPILQ